MPIYIQVINDIKRKIVIGEMQLGSKMPSARDLAIEYQINPNTSNRIYKELEMEQLCFTKRGLGTYLTEEEEKITAIKEEMAQGLLERFITGMKNLNFSKNEVLHLLDEKYEK